MVLYAAIHNINIIEGNLSDLGLEEEYLYDSMSPCSI